MRLISKTELELLRQTYPSGTRIVLDWMDDPQAPPLGGQGTVIGVDDAGSIMTSWDAGGSLSVAYGADICHKVATEEEAKVTLNWYGKHQPEENATCPRCGSALSGLTNRQALSRNADIMICSRCGMEEALEAAELRKRVSLIDWFACKQTQTGGGAWKE